MKILGLHPKVTSSLDFFERVFFSKYCTVTFFMENESISFIENRTKDLGSISNPTQL